MPQRAEFAFNRLIAILCADVGDDDFGAARLKQRGGGAADARGTARHQSGLAAQQARGFVGGKCGKRHGHTLWKFIA